jgi:preprotein translocase subunit YajC
MGGVIFLAVMLLIAWLVVILPQQRRVRAHQALVATLHEGEEVMTTSGILGTITAIDDDVLRLEVAPDVELRVVRGAIARKVEPETAASDGAADDDTDQTDDAGADTQTAPATEE